MVRIQAKKNISKWLSFFCALPKDLKLVLRHEIKLEIACCHWHAKRARGAKPKQAYETQHISSAWGC